MRKKLLTISSSLNKVRQVAFALLLMLIMSSAVHGQDKKVQKAIEKYEFKAYKEAIDMFKGILKSQPDNNLALRYLAYSYRKINEYQLAEEQYSKLITSDSVISDDYYYYGQMLRANGKLMQAEKQFLKYADISDNQFLVTLVMTSIEDIYKWELEGSNYTSEYDAKLNSEYSEYNLLQFKDKYYITSN